MLVRWSCNLLRPYLTTVRYRKERGSSSHAVPQRLPSSVGNEGPGRCQNRGYVRSSHSRVNLRATACNKLVTIGIRRGLRQAAGESRGFWGEGEAHLRLGNGSLYFEVSALRQGTPSIYAVAL